MWALPTRSYGASLSSELSLIRPLTRTTAQVDRPLATQSGLIMAKIVLAEMTRREAGGLPPGEGEDVLV